MKVPRFLDSWFRPNQPEPQPESIEELQKQVDTATMMERWEQEPATKYALERMFESCNRELFDARNKPYEAETQRVLVIRWSAKSDIVDDLLGHIRSLKETRAQILEQFEKEKEDARTGYAGATQAV